MNSKKNDQLPQMRSIEKAIREACPAGFIARTQAAQLMGGTIGHRHLANLDSRKQGPRGRFLVGGRTCYGVDEFIEWLESRISTADSEL